MTQETPGQPEPPRYEHRGRHEKDEKEEEKRGEKDEKTRNQSWDEKRRHDPVRAISWATVFIWAGLCLLAETTDWGPRTFSWWDTWALILAGAGAIFIFYALVRLVVPEHRRPVTGNLILGAILLAVGLEALTDWEWGTLGAFVLIAIGLIIVFGGILRRRP